jgi:hypothetical protein
LYVACLIPYLFKVIYTVLPGLRMSYVTILSFNNREGHIGTSSVIPSSEVMVISMLMKMAFKMYLVMPMYLMKIVMTMYMNMLM